jgi:hypothetical protein
VVAKLAVWEAKDVQSYEGEFDDVATSRANAAIPVALGTCHGFSAVGIHVPTDEDMLAVAADFREFIK